MKDKSSHIKKIEKCDGKNVMYCFNFFRKQLWQRKMQLQSFPIGGGIKKFEDWGEGIKKFQD